MEFVTKKEFLYSIIVDIFRVFLYYQTFFQISLKLAVKILCTMNISNQLSLEQEFELVLYKQKIEQLDLQQSRKLLSETLKTMLLKDNIIKYVIKNSHFRQ